MANQINVISEPLEPRIVLSSYDAAKDFSLTQNPNGPWTYGVRYTETADFAPFGIPAATQLDFGPGAMGWSENSGSPPYVGINTTGDEYVNDGIDLSPGVLVMHPGGNGEYADLRFTFPAAGTFTVAYQAIGIDMTGTTTDEHLFHNAEEIASGTINAYQQQTGDTENITASQGDTLDLLVGPGSNHTFYNDATSVSLLITGASTTQDHLVFSQQPKDGNERTPVPTQVKIEDAKNHLETTAINGVTLLLQAAAGVSMLGYVPFNRGVATFTGATAPLVPAGTNTFVAEETDAIGQFSGSADNVTSTPFTISALHLAFTRQPIAAGAGQPFSVVVQLEDDKNRPVKTSATNSQLNLLPINVSNSNEEPATQTAFVNGKPATLSIPDVGTYSIIASELDPATGQPIDPTTNAMSAPISILGDHLRVTKQPVNVGVNEPIAFAVQLVDYKNKPITSVGVPAEFFVAIETPMTATLVYHDQSFVNGKYDNAKPPTGDPSLVTSMPGTYMMYAAIVQPDSDTDIDRNNPINATSVGFNVIANHFVITTQPTATGVDSPVPFAAKLVDFKKRQVTSVGVPAQFFVSIETQANMTVVLANQSLVDGEYNNTKPPAGDSSVEAPDAGIYMMYIAVVQPDSDTDIDSSNPVNATSIQFTVVPDHLSLKRQPSTAAAGATIPFQIEVLDPKNRPVTIPSSSTDYLELTLNTVTGTGSISNLVPLTPLLAFYDNSTGSAQFSVNASGTYSLTFDVVDNQGQMSANFEAVTSKVFEITD